MLFCRAFVRLDPVARGHICLFWYPFRYPVWAEPGFTKLAVEHLDPPSGETRAPPVGRLLRLCGDLALGRWPLALALPRSALRRR
jgi:hypothetical protein